MKKLNKITLADIGIVLAFSVLVWAVSFFRPGFSYIFSFSVIVLLASFAVLLIRKVGIATLFYLISALLTANIGNFGIVGMDKVVIFLVTGLIFDFILLITKKEDKCKAGKIIAAVIISSGLFPVVSALRISAAAALSQVGSTVNVILLSLLIGIVASLISYFIWRSIRTTKFSMRFELND